MFGFNDITFGLIGRAALVSHYAFTEPQDETPVFTAQPSAQVLYQEGGAMRITGAAAAPTTGFQWQKQNTDGSWSDVAGRTGQTFNVSSASAMAGTYRLKAINGNASAVSNPVDVQSVYLFFQNDISGQTQPVKNNNSSYALTIAAGVRYIGVYYRRYSDDSSFTPSGAAGSRAIPTYATDNATVAPVSKVTTSGQWTPTLTKGTASVTASVGNLSSTLSLNVT